MRIENCSPYRHVFAPDHFGITHNSVATGCSTMLVAWLTTPRPGSNRRASTTVVEELRARRLLQAEELLRRGTKVTDATFVCAREDGQPLQPNSFTHDWDRKIATTALPRPRFPDLQHAHATHMLSSGVQPKSRERPASAFEDRDHARSLQPHAAEHAGRSHGYR